MLKIDQYAYINKLAGVHPAEKIVFALVTMIICLAFSSPATSLLVILLMAGITVFLARIPALFYLKMMFVPMSFLLVGILTVAFVFVKGDYPLLWGVKAGSYMIGVSDRSLVTAGDLFLKSLSAVSCLYFLSLTTPMVEVFAVLRKIHLPALFIELMSLVYRFIFVLLETADRIYVSQASRWGYANLRTAYHSLGQLISNLFSKSYHNSMMLFTTLTSRCYTGELKVLEKSYNLSVKNIILIVTVEAFLIMLSAWSAPIFRNTLGV